MRELPELSWSNTVTTLSELYEQGKLKNPKLTAWKHDCGDKRSCGTLDVTATTSGGTLTVELVFGSSGSSDYDEATFKFNGEEVELGDLQFPDFTAPHFYSGSRVLQRFDDNAEEELQGSLDEWLPSEE